MYLKTTLLLHFCLKTAPSVFVWHFNMSPDPIAYQRQACWFETVTAYARKVFLPGTLIILVKSQLTTLRVCVYLRPHNSSHRTLLENIVTAIFFPLLPHFLYLVVLLCLICPPGWQYVCNYHPFLCVCESSSCHQTERRKGNTLLFICHDKNVKLN